MKQHFNCTEVVNYKENQIFVHWIRNEYKYQSDKKIFDGDNGDFFVEKDYISFQYKGIEVKDNYESDKYTLEGRIYDICTIIDNGKLEELTENKVQWKLCK